MWVCLEVELGGGNGLQCYRGNRSLYLENSSCAYEGICSMQSLALGW